MVAGGTCPSRPSVHWLGDGRICRRVAGRGRRQRPNPGLALLCPCRLVGYSPGGRGGSTARLASAPLVDFDDRRKPQPSEVLRGQDLDRYATVARGKPSLAIERNHVPLQGDLRVEALLFSAVDCSMHLVDSVLADQAVEHRPVRIVVEQAGEAGTLEVAVDPAGGRWRRSETTEGLGVFQLVDDHVGESSRERCLLAGLDFDAFQLERPFPEADEEQITSLARSLPALAATPKISGWASTGMTIWPSSDPALTQVRHKGGEAAASRA